MERLLGFILLAIVGSGLFYLVFAYVLIPLINMFRDYTRLKR